MPATDLRRALNILDPESPLRTEEELREYFVARPLSPLTNLCLLLEASDDPQKVLFSGHRGSGKSTELAKLSHELQDRFFIAMTAEQAMIDQSAVERAAQSRRIAWQVLLTSQQLELLRRVQQTRRVENDEAHRALLHNLSALEYRNDSVWYDVHPIVEQLLASAG